jgi:hypothetical protein
MRDTSVDSPGRFAGRKNVSCHPILKHAGLGVQETIMLAAHPVERFAGHG